MLEAKANYGFFLDENGKWQTWGDFALDALRDQMQSQSEATALDGRHVEWRVQQEGVANILRKIAEDEEGTNVTVIFDPGP